MKLKTILSAIMLALVTAGCSSGGSGTTAPAEGEQSNAPSETSDVEQAVSDTSGEGVITVKAGSPSKQIKSAGIYDNMIQIEDKVYTFPMTVGEFAEKSGCDIEGLDGSVDPLSQYENIKFDGCYLNIYFVNYANEYVPKADYTICAFEVTVNDAETKDVYFPGGISMTADTEEIKAAYGEPTQNDGDYRYYYIDDPVGDENESPCSGDGRSVAIDITPGEGIYSYYATVADEDLESPQKLILDCYRGYNFDNNIFVELTLPKKFFLLYNDAAGGVKDHYSAKYSGSSFEGFIVLEQGFGEAYRAESAEDAAKFLEECGYDTKNNTIKNDDDLFIVYNDIEDGSSYERTDATYFVYKKSTGYCIPFDVSFYSKDDCGESGISEVRSYIADLLSSMNVTEE